MKTRLLGGISAAALAGMLACAAVHAEEQDAQPVEVPSQPITAAVPQAVTQDTAQPAVATVTAPAADWLIRMPSGGKVVCKGEVNFDNAGLGAAPVLYPAPTVAVGLAGVLLHGLLLSSERDHQKQLMQEQADMALAPYRATFDTFTQREMIQRAMENMATEGSKQLVEFSEKPGSAWMITSAPVFYITPDQTTFILENTVAVYAPGRNAPAFQGVVHVVSRARGQEDPLLYWTAEQGAHARDIHARLMAESLDVAAREARRSSHDVIPEKTIRYYEGGMEKVERGQLLSENCGRIVIRNLRGALMSLPVDMPANGAGCNTKTPPGPPPSQISSNGVH